MDPVLKILHSLMKSMAEEDKNKSIIKYPDYKIV